MILVLPAGQGTPGRRDFDSQTSGAQLLPVMSSFSLGRKRELFEHPGGTWGNTPKENYCPKNIANYALFFRGHTHKYSLDILSFLGGCLIPPCWRIPEPKSILSCWFHKIIFSAKCMFFFFLNSFSL